MRDRLDQLVGEMVAKGIGYSDAMREFDKQFITQVLSTSDWNLGRAAARLSVHRNTLTRKMRELKIRVPRR